MSYILIFFLVEDHRDHCKSIPVVSACDCMCGHFPKAVVTEGMLAYGLTWLF